MVELSDLLDRLAATGSLLGWVDLVRIIQRWMPFGRKVDSICRLVANGLPWELAVPALVLGSFLGGLATLVETAAITVRDTGHGIPKENQEKIFEPFFSTKSPGEGTGLGLFVTRGIIEKLGGTIELESQVGQGASFCISLPTYHEIKEEVHILPI